MDGTAESARLEFSLEEGEFKMFKNSLRSLTKIGVNLMICASTDEIQFSTLTKNSTACLSFTCSAPFFSNYAVFNCGLIEAVVPFKNVLAPFRSQKVKLATFSLVVSDSRLSVTIECENGLVKKFSFPTLEDTVVTVGEIETLPVRVVAEPASLTKYLSTFHSGVGEIALAAHPNRHDGDGPTVELRSYADPTKAATDEALHANISIYNSLSFINYTNTLDTVVEIVFSIKDFKAMLSLCEVMRASVQLNFKEPGNPLVVHSHYEVPNTTIKARLVIATIDTGGFTLPSAPEAGGGMPAPALPIPVPMPQAPAADDLGELWDDEEEGGIANTPPEDVDMRMPTMPGLIPSRI